MVVIIVIVIISTSNTSSNTGIFWVPMASLHRWKPSLRLKLSWGSTVSGLGSRIYDLGFGLWDLGFIGLQPTWV